MNAKLIQEVLFQLFTFFGGFGMFLYGMNIMAEGLQKSVGSRMKSLLGMLTSNRFLAVALGAVVTAIIQSSSATTVMVVGFVNAGLMNLVQATGVIMGANIGTTITAWLVSSSEWAAFLEPEKLAPLAVGIGVLMVLFSGKKSKKQIGEIIIGFGLLFIGLEMMGEAIEPYKDSESFKQAFLILGRNPLFGILAGFAVTAIIQSSSASVSILQTLAIQGMVPWNAAVYIILGQNIGTCVTAMFSSIGANRTAKRAAFIHLLFNITGTIIFAIGTIIFFKFINVSLGNEVIDATDISIFHTVFNITNTVILFPFANKLVYVAEHVVRGEDKPEKSKDRVMLRHLDERILETPSFAVENSIKEVVNMGELAKANLDLATESMMERDLSKIEKVRQNEEVVNQLAQLITAYLVKLNNAPLTERQKDVVTHLFNTVNDIERIGDHARDIAGLGEYITNYKVDFTDQAKAELSHLASYTSETVALALKARENNDYRLIHKVEDREDDIDTIEDELREAHIERLSNYECDPKMGVVFLDSVSHYERVSDHALKIAYYVKDEAVI